MHEDVDPKWWNDLSPRETPDHDSYMSFISNMLGDAIDLISDLIVTAAILLSGIPVHLMAHLTGHDLEAPPPFENVTARFD